MLFRSIADRIGGGGVDQPGRQPGLQSALKVHFLVPARSSPEWLPRISAQVQRGAGALFGPLFPQALQLGEENCGIGALLAGFQREELLQQILLARDEFGRHFHLDLHHKITDAAAVERGHAAYPETYIDSKRTRLNSSTYSASRLLTY